MSSTVWLSCGVLRAELQALHDQGRIRGQLMFLDSMLHMDPPRLEQILHTLLGKQAATPHCLVLVYGDCCSRMLDLTRQFHAGRVNAINCAQLLLGRVRYRRLMQQQAFMVLPEWAVRWKEIMHHELGLTEQVAQDLMGEHRGMLVYLDTGLIPVPAEELEAFAHYCGLPWHSESITLDTMLEMLLTAETEAQTVHLSGEQSP